MLVLGTVTLLFMVTGGRAVVPAAQVPATGGHYGSALTPGTHMVTIESLDFVDARTGFALVTTCQPDGEDCAHTLAMTSDTGLTWRATNVPWGPADETSDTPRLYVFDRLHLVLDADVDDHRRWRSQDGGVSWRPVADPGRGTVPAAPPGSMIVAEDPGSWGATGGPLFALAPDGTGRWLAHQPAGPDDLDGDPVRAPDGGIWLTGGATGAPEWVAISRDRGRTWRSVRTPAAATGTCTLLIPAGTAYLGCVGDPAPVVYRSTDGGRSWQVIHAPAAWSILAAAGAVPLCTDEAGTVYTLTRAGAFARVANAPPATAVASAGAYAVLVTGATGLRYLVSADGTDWREITPSG